MQRPVGVRRGVTVVLCPVGLLRLALPRLSRLAFVVTVTRAVDLSVLRPREPQGPGKACR